MVGSLYFNFTPKTLSVLTGIASNSLSTHKIRKVNKINKKYLMKTLFVWTSAEDETNEEYFYTLGI